MKYHVSIVHTLSIVIAMLMCLPSCEEKQPLTGKNDSPHPPANTFQTVCATCHGEKGQGIKEKMAPSIASLPRWYVEEQIAKFRSGLRGNHPDDVTGQQMRAAVLALSEEQLAESLDILETFPVVDHEPTLQADLQRGGYLYREYCMECHRFNGRGEIAFRSSHVAGLQDWYLLAQWDKFKTGTRGYHPDDEGGHKMRKAVNYLTHDTDVHSVIHYISTLAKKYPETSKP